MASRPSRSRSSWVPLLAPTLGAAILFACSDDVVTPIDDGGPATDTGDVTGDGDAWGDGDGDSWGDGDGDPPGDGDGDPPGDGDGDPPGDGDGDPCTSAGCPCSANASACDEGLYCDDQDTCVAPVCGDGLLEPGEQCDEGDLFAGGGCDADCTFTEILAVDAASYGTCVLIEGGRVRCWGRNGAGQLGYGHTQTIGDDETPATAGDVVLPVPAVALSAGDAHTCILTADQSVRCWGSGIYGRLGYANTQTIGDDEFPAAIADVDVGGAVLEIDAGGRHTCARLSTGRQRCWGEGNYGQLGYGNLQSVGDDEHPASAGDVPVGIAALSQATGLTHTCAVTAVGGVRCWGASTSGELGYPLGASFRIGDDEPASAGGDVSVVPEDLPANTKVSAVALGQTHTCALFETGDVLCWGSNGSGQLGQANTVAIGDDEAPSTLAAIELPAPAVAITTGSAFTCALLEDQRVSCWGQNAWGQLGQGNTLVVGDDETPASVATIELGGPVRAIAAGGYHACAIMAEGNQLRCWGRNGDGQLGYGHTDDVGDDEPPVDAGPVPVF